MVGTSAASRRVIGRPSGLRDPAILVIDIPELVVKNELGSALMVMKCIGAIGPGMTRFMLAIPTRRGLGSTFGRARPSFEVN